MKEAKNQNLTDLYSGNTYKVAANGDITVMLPAAEEGGTVIIPYKASSNGSSNNSSDSSSDSTSGSNQNTPSKDQPQTEEDKEINLVPAFIDIADSWAKDYINILAQKQITTGMDAEHFNPKGKVTRAEFATFICRALHLEGGMESIQFSDVAPDAWYSNSINSLTELGIINGYEDGSFRPQREITREEMLTILIKAYYCIQEQEMPDEMEALHFKDSDEISLWAVESIKAAYKLGLVEGDLMGYLNPKATATRAETAKVIVRLLEVSQLLKNE